jgi:hypothetical protein
MIRTMIRRHPDAEGVLETRRSEVGVGAWAAKLARTKTRRSKSALFEE